MAEVRQSLEQLVIREGPWIEETRVKLGQGHYGTVFAVKIRGLQCAGKKFDASLFEKTPDRRQQLDEAGEAVTAGQVFVEQCLQLAQVRHPNVAQLLGVLFDSGGCPTLVSEVLPLSLARCLDDYQHIPAYAKSSVLLDVANGLRYAHEQKRPMVHGRLCPEKVLLTISLQAKICGFVNPSLVALPDSSYMPPEVAADHRSPLTAKGDVFSYGNLVLHVLTQGYPQPTVKELPDPADAGRTVTCSEAERREVSLRELGESAALRGLVRRCLENDRDARPAMAEVLQEVEHHAVSTPPPYASVLQVMQEVEQTALLKDNLASLTQTLEGKQAELEAKHLEVEGLTQELDVKEKASSACKEELDAYKQTVHSKERRMQMHDQALRAKDSLIKAKAREIAAKNQQLTAKESQLAASNRRIATLEERLTSGRSHNLRYTTTPQRSPSRSPAFTRSQQVSPTFKESPYKYSHSAEAEDLAVKAGEVLRRTTPGRRGKTVPMSDGFFFQNKFEPPKTGIYGQQPVDPRLASILAKRHQRYEQTDTVEPAKNLDQGQQMESTSDQVQLRRQVAEGRQSRSASASNGMSPELQKLMNKQRSQIDVEPPLPKPEPPPTVPRRRQGASPMEDSTPTPAEQPATQPQEQPTEQPATQQATEEQEQPSPQQPTHEQERPSQEQPTHEQERPSQEQPTEEKERPSQEQPPQEQPTEEQQSPQENPPQKQPPQENPPQEQPPQEQPTEGQEQPPEKQPTEEHSPQEQCEPPTATSHPEQGEGEVETHEDKEAPPNTGVEENSPQDTEGEKEQEPVVADSQQEPDASTLPASDEQPESITATETEV